MNMRRLTGNEETMYGHLATDLFSIRLTESAPVIATDTTTATNRLPISKPGSGTKTLPFNRVIFNRGVTLAQAMNRTTNAITMALSKPTKPLPFGRAGVIIKT
jgi:hypothetical protein